MKKCFKSLIIPISVATMLVFLLQICTFALNFQMEELITVTPGGDRIAYNENMIQWDEQLESLSSIPSNESFEESESITTVSAEKINELSNVKENITIVLEIPKMIVCLNQAIGDIKYRIKSNENGTDIIKWYMHVFKEMYIIKFVCVVQTNSGSGSGSGIQKPYDFDFSMLYSGFEYEHPRSGGTIKKEINDKLIKNYMKRIKKFPASGYYEERVDIN